MSQKVNDFLRLNATYGVVSKRPAVADGVTYVLANGRTFHLTKNEAEDAGIPKWERD
jgi:hypothetical protein